MDLHTAQALIRFGLGRRGEEPLPSDPVAWLQAQVEGEDTAVFAGLPTAADGLTLLREQQRLILPPGTSLVGPVYQQDVRAQTELLLTTDAPFRERLVWFWANHFTVSTRQAQCSATVGPFVREAIRPYVTGPFFGMLIAVMQHPAMLMYLDNNVSVGPDSTVGRRQKRGLNENLARECLELHTLGVDGGYTQADVTELARVISGWSVDLERLSPGFLFRPDTHEPGGKVLLDRRIPPGEAGGMAALELLANHPATHRHLATKLVRHFVADAPPPGAVAVIEGVLRDTGGDLGAAAIALLHLPEAWAPLGKVRSPQDYAVAVLRALNLPAEKLVVQGAPPVGPLSGVLTGLGQPVWAALLPNGWADDAAGWTGPEASMRRVDWAYSIAGRAGDRDAADVAEAALGPLLEARTRDALHGAGSRRDALALLLSSPEFQRR